MSDLDRRFSLHFRDLNGGGGGSSVYVDTLAEVRKTIRRRQGWGERLALVAEGYADYEDSDSGTVVTRRTLGPVPLEVLAEDYPVRATVRQEVRDVVRAQIGSAFPTLTLPPRVVEAYTD